MTTNGALHLGLVGCGRWGRLILRDLRALGCRVSVVEISAQGRRDAREGGAERVVEQIADLPDLDGAVIATPTTAHVAAIEQLLPRGVPLYCEKPLCCDVAAAERIVEHAGGRVFVMDKWRYHTGVRELARIARSGELGPVHGLRTTRVGAGHTQADINLAWTLLPHEFSIALEVLGALPEPQSAVAQVVDVRLQALRLRSGAAPWHESEIGARAGSKRRRIELVCRDGVAVADEDEPHVVTLGRAMSGVAAAAVERRAVADRMPLTSELEAFLGHLRGGPPPLSSAADALAVVRVIVRVHELAGIAPGSL